MAQDLDVIAFDVIETLFGIDPLEERLRSVGLPSGTLKALFAALLRDAFALDAAGTPKPFHEVARAAIEVVMASHGLEPDEAAVATVLQGFAELQAHPDVRPAFEAVRDAGVRIVTLTNGSAANTRKLLGSAGVEDFVEKVISVDEVRHWKPHAAVYLHAAKQCGVEPSRMALVAAHAWDTHGAKQAGLVTGWVQRQDKRYMGAMAAPDITGASLIEVVAGLLAQPDSNAR